MLTIPTTLPFIKDAENRESFFRRISVLFPSLDPRYKTILKAYDDAKDAFRDKYRDEPGVRYFEHIRAVTLILIDHLRVKDYELIVAALLHDIVEDNKNWTIGRVRIEYGERVALLVQYLTKPESGECGSKAERNHLYHSRFEAAPRDFFLVKLSDRLHNLLTLGACPPEKRARKIAETKMYYLPYAERHLILLHEIEAVIRALELKESE